MKPADALLLAAHDLTAAGVTPITMSQLTVAAWRRHPAAYGLPGFKVDYPDKHRVAGDLAHKGPQNLFRRGCLERVPGGGYRLTEYGKLAAARLLNPPPAPRPAGKPRYEVLTYDPKKQKFTPQISVRRGPYTLFGLRAAIRKLRNVGYDCIRTDGSVRVQRLPDPEAA
jgi:hypothetical protein